MYKKHAVLVIVCVMLRSWYWCPSTRHGNWAAGDELDCWYISSNIRSVVLLICWVFQWFPSSWHWSVSMLVSYRWILRAKSFGLIGSSAATFCNVLHLSY